jgi:Dyp-type peroxidase family
MSTINLDQRGIDINGAEFNAIASNLQSNILKSHSRDHARLLFINFIASKAGISEWVNNFISQAKFVVSAMDQKIDSAQHAANRAADNGIKSKTVANFYLTANGYKHLELNPDAFTDIAFNENDDNDDNDEEENDGVISGNNDFIRGMKSKKVNNKLNDPELNEWEQEYNTDIHAMILLADDDAPTLDIEMGTIKTSLAGIAVILKEEIGNNITNIFGGKKRNIEHFGYADGISQPTYFSGVPLTSPFELQPLSIILVKDPFIDNADYNYGSFLVFRKLEQDTDGFKNKVAELSVNLGLNANQQGKITNEDYAGALAVGRFKDGTPLIKSDIPLDQAPAFNDFKYENIDRGAHKCPFHAHIRKANPRGQGVLVGERYITRRGIPYGQPNSNDKKGLLFMCFQSNLKRQFNFIQKTWSNAPGFPPLRGRPGIDPLIGQGHEGGQSWPMEYGSHDEINFDFSGYIKMKGGEYFFAPSIGFLKNI